MTKRTRSTSGGTRTERTTLWRPVRRRKAPRGRHRYRPQATFRYERIDRSAPAAIAARIKSIAAEVRPAVVFLGTDNVGEIAEPVTSVAGGVAEDPTYDVHVVRYYAPPSVPAVRLEEDRTRTSDERADPDVSCCVWTTESAGFSSADNSGSTARPIAGIVHIRCAERTCAIDGRPG